VDKLLFMILCYEIYALNAVVPLLGVL